MSVATQRRWLAAGLAVLALWPALHHGLARRVGFDPWELFGIAMYTVPHPQLQVEILVRIDGEDRPLRTAGRLRERLAEFARRRATLGRFVSDEAFARSLLAENPQWEAVTLLLHRGGLDPASARWTVEVERREVERASRSGSREDG